jgi:predicted kinase
MIVIVFGLPASGKSYFASRLAKKINAGYINSDRLRMEIFRVRTYSEEEKAAVYNAMLLKMKEAIAENTDFVLDATLHKNETRKLFANEIEGRGSIIFIEVKASENISRERLKDKRSYSEADFKVYKFIQQQWEPMTESHLVLESTDENIDDMLRKTLLYLKQENDKGTNH